MRSSWQKEDLKRPVYGHIHIIPAFHCSCKCLYCGICRRETFFFPVHSFSSSPSLSPFTIFHSTGVKENHVIVFVDSYQRQTPCIKIAECLCGDKHEWAAAVLHKQPMWTNSFKASTLYHIANHGYVQTFLHVAILYFFKLNFQYFVHWLGLGKDNFLAWNTCFDCHKHGRRGPKVSLKTPSAYCQN